LIGIDADRRFEGPVRDVREFTSRTGSIVGSVKVRTGETWLLDASGSSIRSLFFH